MLMSVVVNMRHTKTLLQHVTSKKLQVMIGDSCKILKAEFSVNQSHSLLGLKTGVWQNYVWYDVHLYE